MCDAISDAILDALIAKDPMCRVACETAATTGLVMIMGEISSIATIDYQRIVRNTIREIGYDNAAYGFDAETCAVVTILDKQSEDIALGVDKALEANPDAHPLFHSDRGFQYTNRVFHHKLEQKGITQSMSRVGCCIDNGPMEGFWGILKREMYYGKRFSSKQELMCAIKTYIHYYNHKRVQRNLGVLTPMEKYSLYFAA
jgi:hypothetical protein